MIQFFKRLFAAIFGKKKPAAAEAIYPGPAQINQMDQELIRKQQIEELTKVKMVRKDRKYTMRNNRILIHYNGGCRNVRMNGQIESMRCTRLERAREIALGIQSYCVEKIIFADHSGTQFIIKTAVN